MFSVSFYLSENYKHVNNNIFILQPVQDSDWSSCPAMYSHDLCWALQSKWGKQNSHERWLMGNITGMLIMTEVCGVLKTFRSKINLSH